MHYSTYLAAGSGATSLSLFSPIIVAGLGYRDLQAQLFTVPPYAVAYVVTLRVALWSDSRHMRGLFACAGFSTAAISFLILGELYPMIHLVSYWTEILIPSHSCYPGHPLRPPLRLLDHRHQRLLLCVTPFVCMGRRQRSHNDWRVSSDCVEHRI